MNILTISGLRKKFGNKEVLCGLELLVPEHSIFGFIGKNGAGKTTAMEEVLGLLKPDEGEIFVAGEKVIYGQAATNRNIGYLPDVPEFYPYMTPMEYLRLCGEICGMEKTEIRNRSRELLEMVGLEGEKHRIKGFSRGMKQRLGIAQALLNRPKLVICDEPASALDPVGRKEILDLLLSVGEQATVFFSTHILSDVERICTNAAFLNEGRIVKQGSISELKKIHYSKEFIVETVKEEDSDRLLHNFENARQAGKNSIIFNGKEDRMFLVLQYITEHKIFVQKVEQMEPSLEALFLEVVKG